MLPGPDQVIACPNCRGLARYFTLRSGNTFGARVWTDGKQVAPMLPRPPAVVKCLHCAKCYWLEDAEKIGEVGDWENSDQPVNPEWVNAEHVEEPTVLEYDAAIRAGLARDRTQERSLRILAWWRGNDPLRGDNEVPPDPPDPETFKAFRDNLEALVDLLDNDENDLLMKAEALRELGRFSEASRILNSVTSREFREVVRQLRERCECRDPQLSELSLEH